jgi:serine/threonine protein kinase
MGILHRDITHSNVLIGIKGFESEDGERGVIIDLDMAIKNRRPVLDICKDFRTVCDRFPSLVVYGH